jgi:large conductance mechanosensitive channel
MLSGFKQFILRGNVVDMAVGVVIGAAFGGVVTALTKDLLTPLSWVNGQSSCECLNRPRPPKETGYGSWTHHPPQRRR